MRVRNETPYDTRAIRRCVSLAYALVRKHEGPAWWWKNLTVRVKTRRTRWGLARTGGYAYLNGGPITLSLPLPQHGAIPTRRVVFIAAHELMHCYGYNHGQFTEPEITDAMVAPLGFTDLPVRAPRAKPPRDLVAERYASVVRRLRAWESKQKRAATALRKLRRQQREYERRHPRLVA